MLHLRQKQDNKNRRQKAEATCEQGKQIHTQKLLPALTKMLLRYSLLIYNCWEPSADVRKCFQAVSAVIFKQKRKR